MKHPMLWRSFYSAISWLCLFSILAGADSQVIHTLKVSRESGDISLIFDNDPSRDDYSMIKALKDNALLSRGETVKIKLLGMTKADLDYSPRYNQCGLILTLLAAGAKLEYSDGSDVPITYTVIEWSHFDGSKKDVDSAKFTWNGTPIDHL
jgi:hypothetical protein